ncbi:hypothetical protein CBR_g45896 [Chara braunii]|uniref:Protein kinase domain-containing protein n=1 Tax=Chara braunii TaxID=69332 RepID=A0A388LZR3_CHABU|nr:hypothetical protein CBR_g45896 [Chara braunii]|eukprot:GBG87742.1 hypothetical protein CBR_g45896 [Chara braunii]
MAVAATMVCGCYLVLVLTACRVSALRTEIWSLASNPSWHAGDRLLQESTIAAPSAPQEEPQIEYSRFVNGSVTRVTLHTPRANETTGKDCRSVITDLVVGSGELYYILHQYCQVDDTLKDRTLSIRRLNLSQVQNGNGSSPQEEDDSLISYMWPFGQPNGIITREPADFGDAHVTGMGLSKDGMHLVLSVTNRDPKVISDSGTISGDQNRSRFTSLSLADGSRSSSDPLSTLVQAWALESNKRFLYYLQSDSVLIKVTVNDVGLPNGPPNQVTRWGFQMGANSAEKFQSGSLLSDGSCLYSVTSNDGLFGRELGDGYSVSSAIALHLVPLLGKEMDVVATPQGCHVFTAANNTVAVFKLLRRETTCGTMSDRSPLPRYFGEADVTALALGDNGDGLNLYVGTSDGSVYRVPLDMSELSSCIKPKIGQVHTDMYNDMYTTLRYREGVYTRSLIFFPVNLPLPGLAGVIFCILVLVPSMWYLLAAPTYVYAAPLIFVLIIGIASCSVFCVRGFRKRRRRDLEQVSNNHAETGRPTTSSVQDCTAMDFWGLRPSRVKQFGWKLLSDCTENFSETYRIGDKGAFGKVYRGSLDGKDVAIKVMTGELTDVKRNQFVAEVNTLSAVNHVNLIQLTGYCQEGNQCILVYPYFRGGCLHERLFPHTANQRELAEDSPRPLTLQERMSIAFQIARGLQYLHDDAKPPIIHRDIKSSNVLLGDGCEDKLYVVVADFGLAAIGERVLDTGHDHVVITSHIGGTFGYMSPEYMLRGELSEKNDVYSFGVLVLELLTGRKVVTRAPSGVGWQTLVDWVKPFLRDQGEKPQDPSLDMPRAILDHCLWDQMAGDSTKQMLMNTFRLAWECVHEDYGSRPAMRSVVQRFHSMLLDVGWDFLIRTMDMEHLLAMSEAEDTTCKDDDAESQDNHEVLLE